jgi:hypothetical protein
MLYARLSIVEDQRLESSLVSMLVSCIRIGLGTPYCRPFDWSSENNTGEPTCIIYSFTRVSKKFLGADEISKHRKSYFMHVDQNVVPLLYRKKLLI